jgi:hypothetical protein
MIWLFFANQHGIIKTKLNFYQYPFGVFCFQLHISPYIARNPYPFSCYHLSSFTSKMLLDDGTSHRSSSLCFYKSPYPLFRSFKGKARTTWLKSLLIFVNTLLAISFFALFYVSQYLRKVLLCINESKIFCCHPLK